MSALERFDRVTGRFTEVVAGVPDWAAPAPVEGWTAADVVAHLVDWLPGLLAADDVVLAVRRTGNPAQDWARHTSAVRALLASPRAAEPFTHQHLGTLPLAEAVDRFWTTDVLMHTWDLATASGQDAGLDEAECAQLLAGMEPMEEVLRASGQYGPRVPVPDDAPAVDRLMGLVGRDPASRRG
ncbi:maleylpyruvate isomerase N-terminal domain-containing protein [Klenkia sp. PcliD-1-E]|uniref:maleylpyruvate isomerase N-terminal domain-containing protein n=1 Tax=Klenkia sp. PcliD-1-E TaxID=2954492 RepID=UPI002096F663|nr:maleylpyruvate isomerase N-terminal domain-containing protein [Klenkia sp. PcliD-1-E]MCO7220487.1 maleylpyruvate isomerase N-terminal domain-containing protein [Klenkia sp. PcliD-1-E]